MRESPRGTQQLRNQMLRRLPTKAELARRTPVVLTERDKSILVAIYTHGFLTTELIEVAFFPPPAGGRQSPCSQAYERLQRLWEWSFVERVEPPMARSLGGRRPYLYALGRRGPSIVEQYLAQSAPRVQRRRLDRLDSMFIEHDLTIAAFWANLVARLRSTSVKLARWVPERELRARRMRVKDPESERWLPFLPDAAFELHYPTGTVHCGLLEVDMGTLTLARFRRKLRAFELALAQGLFAKHWRHKDFEVFVLTHSDARLNHLWRAARDVVPPERWEWYFFATFQVLAPDRVDGGGAWTNVEGSTFGLLYPEAHEDDRGQAGDQRR